MPSQALHKQPQFYPSIDRIRADASGCFRVDETDDDNLPPPRVRASKCFDWKSIMLGRANQSAGAIVDALQGQSQPLIVLDHSHDLSYQIADRDHVRCQPRKIVESKKLLFWNNHMSEPFDFPVYHAASRDQTGGSPMYDPAEIKLLNGTWAGCHVVDMSEVGATIRISDDLSLPVILELFSGPANTMRQCRLIHRADGIAVVRFAQCATEAKSSEAFVAGPVRTDQRVHDRYQVYWPAICRSVSGFSWSSNVSDVSAGGMRLNNCPPLSVGDRVVVGLADVGTFSCRVAWSNPPHCGMEFLPADGELDDESFDELATSLGSLPTSVLKPSTG